MHLANNTKINLFFLQKSLSECLRNHACYFLFISSHLIPSMTETQRCLADSLSHDDDRLMKRVQSRPAGWFCTCSKKHSVMSGWFQRAGGHTNARSIKYGHAQMKGGDLGGARVSLIQQNEI